MKIIKNAIRCKICGDEIESTFRHEYVSCSCGACAVDGGHDYLRRSFALRDCYDDISVVIATEEEKNPVSVTDGNSSRSQEKDPQPQ